MIKTIIDSKGLTPYKVSKETKIPYTTIYELYSGKRSIDLCNVQYVHRIAIYLDVTIEQLINGDAFLVGYYDDNRYEMYVYDDKTIVEYEGNTIVDEPIHKNAWSNKIYRAYAEMIIDEFKMRESFNQAYDSLKKGEEL